MAVPEPPEPVSLPPAGEPLPPEPVFEAAQPPSPVPSASTARTTPSVAKRKAVRRIPLDYHGDDILEIDMNTGL